MTSCLSAGLRWRESLFSQKAVEQLWIEQDASAGTPITRFNGNFKDVEFLKYDITAFAYHVFATPQSAFIIGVGGGRDVLTARLFEVPAITACDINPITIGLVKNKYRDFAGNIYGLPGIDVQVAEGRNFARSQDRKFDLVQISLIDSWAATVAGAFALSENNLYTVEAFTDYLDRLQDDGILSVTRYIFQPDTQSIRVAIVARTALEQLGIKHPEDHIAVIATRRGNGVATLLIKKKPFTPRELERIRTAARDLAFEVIYLPGPAGDPDFVRAISEKPLDEFLRSNYFDLTPSTDDRPFFFQSMRFGKSLDLIRGTEISGQRFNYYAPLVLLALLGLSSILVLLVYAVPLWISTQVDKLPARWGLYFIILGVGFMFVEIPLLQKGSLYLGHPTLSLSVVLCSMLVCAGFGSFWSRKFTDARLTQRLRICLLTVVALVLLAALASGPLIRGTISFPLIARASFYVLVVGVPAFFMGTAFPSAVRLVARDNRNSIAWVWALNGGASVSGSILAMCVAMTVGYTFALVLGAVCYCLALALSSPTKRAPLM